MPTLREEVEAAAAEIQQLAQRRVDGATDYQNSDWCDHAVGRARFKIECVECIGEIITAAVRAQRDPRVGTFTRERP